MRHLKISDQPSHTCISCTISGVMLAVEAIVENLKKMSKPVTTPEEIAQVEYYCSYIIFVSS